MATTRDPMAAIWVPVIAAHVTISCPRMCIYVSTMASFTFHSLLSMFVRYLSRRRREPEQRTDVLSISATPSVSYPLSGCAVNH